MVGGGERIFGLKIRDVVLAMLVLQTTSIVLLMRYSKTRPGSSPAYRATAAVLMAEVLKLPSCIIMAGRTVGFPNLYKLLNDEVWGNFGDTLKCSIPAIAFTLQGNLLFVALANLEAPTYQVTYQCKTVFTALFSRLILGRRLKESQWLALLLLCLGGVLVSDLQGGKKASEASNGGSFVVGILAVLSAATLSSSSSVYFEMMLKKKSVSPQAQAASLWLRNIQLGLFALPLAGFAMLFNDGDFVRHYGVLHGFDILVWLSVVLNGVGGLLVAATMKYADNIVKCFAAALAILSGTLLSVPIFGFALSPMFSLGVGCTIVASVLYSSAPERPGWLGGPTTASSTSSSETVELLPNGKTNGGSKV